MPDNRKLPATGLAHDQERFSRLLDGSKKVAVVWTTAADTLTLVGYYDTVSAANTVSDTAVDAVGAKPSVWINWAHSDISHIPVGPILHPDAREDLPAWLDADANA